MTTPLLLDINSDKSFQVEVDDGIDIINEIDEESLDVLIVDAGSNDASIAISCPPAPFLEPQFLSKALGALRPRGLLVLNCVTRSESAFQKVLQSMQVNASARNCHQAPHYLVLLHLSAPASPFSPRPLACLSVV